jgi:peptide/nickel transport system substrate-binding protein
VLRFRDEEYDRTFREADREMDPVKRTAMMIRLNDIVCNSNHIIPLLSRPNVSGQTSAMRTALSGWDNYHWMIGDWYKET